MNRARQICAAPCRECPFRRAAAPGYLGECSGDPLGFLASFANGDAPLPCHMRVAWDRVDRQARAASAPLCHGALVMLRNEVKLPRDPELAAAVNSVKPDRVTFFANRLEFASHHEGPGLRLNGRRA